MAKVKVRVLKAVVDGKGKGEIISIEEKSAKYLESIDYVERVAGKQAPKKDDGDNGDNGNNGESTDK